MSKRKYFPLKEAENIPGNSIDDIIHFAETGQLKLYVLAAGKLFTGLQKQATCDGEVELYEKHAEHEGLVELSTEEILRIKRKEPIRFHCLEQNKQGAQDFEVEILVKQDDLLIKPDDVTNHSNSQISNLAIMNEKLTLITRCFNELYPDDSYTPNDTHDQTAYNTQKAIIDKWLLEESLYSEKVNVELSKIINPEPKVPKEKTKKK